MTEHAHDRPRGPHWPDASALDLRAGLDRRLAELADGPTMHDLLTDLDAFRTPAGPTTADTVAALDETRTEREEHLESLWRRS